VPLCTSLCHFQGFLDIPAKTAKGRATVLKLEFNSDDLDCTDRHSNVTVARS